MKLLFLLLLIPTAASAQSVTPNFTTGTMTQTVVMNKQLTRLVPLKGLVAKLQLGTVKT